MKGNSKNFIRKDTLETDEHQKDYAPHLGSRTLPARSKMTKTIEKDTGDKA